MSSYNADLTGAQDGSVRMFEWGHSQQITCFRSGGNPRITRMRFNYQGNKVLLRITFLLKSLMVFKFTSLKENI